MIITVASFKGGQAKTTTAVHLAAFFSQRGKTLLIDGDPNRSATSWAKRKGLPFMVCDERQAARYSRDYEHILIDTQARPTAEDLQALAEGCDLLIIPCTPDALSLDALFLIVEALEHLGSNRFRILLTIVPPQAKPGRRRGHEYAQRGRTTHFQKRHQTVCGLPEGRITRGSGLRSKRPQGR